MKKALLTLILSAAAGTAVISLMADESHRKHEDEAGAHREWRGQRVDGASGGYLADAGYARYRQECGDCHMAYPPPLLPATSWKTLMSSLDNHFGDNAELDPARSAEISAYLARYSAGRDRSEYGDRAARASRGKTPLRITGTDYFIGQHHEIPRNMVEDNAGIERFSRCDACHAGAADGSFDEHQVRIPGYGRWDD